MWIVVFLFQLRNQAISFTKELYETQQTHHAIEVSSFFCVTLESEWPKPLSTRLDLIIPDKVEGI